ncbi:MAG TPA: hypothetical protein VK502_01420, partial [Candidatus Saccharimonadales bacterium]|nr:hypothetical protein [Candidatus Saccharimonadales bacterium]
MSERLLDIKKDGVEMITYPEDLSYGVEHAATLWKAFCDLPPEIKRRFSAENTQNGVGYESKSGEGPHGDTKENFDFSIRGLNALLEAVETTNNKVAADFIAAVQSLGEHAAPMIEQFGER